MAGKEFLGQGMKFPPQINKATGRFMTVSEDQSVKESIYLILMTSLGERPLREDFGSNLVSYTFMDMSITRLNIMIRTLKDEILNQEPRIDELSIKPDPESGDGRIIFNIEYTVSSTNTRDNIVFPFYLNRNTEMREEEPEHYEYEPVEEIEY
ncbi:MAG: GPW/gp25 family protein [Lachnospiraceae bacterium]|nr:GPW/gp25 family protein [Lachnospiraceae bacterium]